VRTTNDKLPSGLAAAMSPLLIDWQSSRLSDAPDDGDYYVLRNVIVGGNPAEGVTFFGCVRVPRLSIVSAEFVTVPLRSFWLRKLGAHGMTRMIFDPRGRPRMLWGDGRPFGMEPSLQDLVLSWEAWRGPHVPFKLIWGLDPQKYVLTPRCFDGAQRFLEDGLQGRDWKCYPIAMPGGKAGMIDLLDVSLRLADRLGRAALRRTLGPDIIEAGPPDALPPDVDGDTTYHTFERSCVTEALYTVDLGARRAAERNGTGRRDPLPIVPVNVPAWLDSWPRAGRWGRLLRVLRAMHWIARQPDVLPIRAHRILERGGLLTTDGDEPLPREYTLRGRTPYGSLREHFFP
jgi:hypothetical protein